MKTPKGQIERAGKVVFHDASLAVWEEGLNPGMSWDERKAWERQFKRDVFARIVQTLNRLGWAVGPQTYIFTGNNSRYCRKGDLQADVRMCGRHIELDFFQSVNAPDRPEHDGHYQSYKELHMPYVLRLEMERTRQRICNYLCNVFTSYAFEPPKISSANPDPLAYFNDSWDSEHEKRRGTHRFKRGDDGWPSREELSSWNRKDKDGTELSHGDVRWLRDRKGRLLSGRVYGGINGMWMFVYGPDRRDYTHEPAGRFFTYSPGMPRKLIDEEVRRKRLDGELQKAIAAMDFERAAVLRDILFPGVDGMKEAA